MIVQCWNPKRRWYWSYNAWISTAVKVAFAENLTKEKLGLFTNTGLIDGVISSGTFSPSWFWLIGFRNSAWWMWAPVINSIWSLYFEIISKYLSRNWGFQKTYVSVRNQFRPGKTCIDNTNFLPLFYVNWASSQSSWVSPLSSWQLFSEMKYILLRANSVIDSSGKSCL